MNIMEKIISDFKKEHILRCVKLGMQLYKAQIYAQCTEEEIKLLDNDKNFLKQVEQQYALQEYELLLKHNNAIAIATEKGNASPIQWRLSKLNPNHYASKDKVIELKTPEALTVNLKGKGIDINNKDNN